MCPDKADVNNPVRIIYPNNQSVFVPGNVENHSSILQNAGASQISLDIGWVCPVSLQNKSVPGKQRFFGIRIGRGFPKNFQCGQSDYSHKSKIVPNWDYGKGKGVGRNGKLRAAYAFPGVVKSMYPETWQYFYAASSGVKYCCPSQRCSGLVLIACPKVSLSDSRLG
nr:hypothetical protein [Desulfomicrobium norvegicum]